ncbi:MAG TPA: serine protease [Solirubrobacter sp.]|nr:serine protease [Solirubrobacter sp.]
MTPLLDTFPYPFADPHGQELHTTLTQLHPSVPMALAVVQRAGLDTTFLNPQQAPVLFWHDVLEQAAGAGLLRALVTTVRDLLNAAAPRRPFLDALLADAPAPIAAEPRRPDGSAAFLSGDDSVAEPEALLYHDDLTLQIGRVPALIETLGRLLVLAPAVCRLAVDFQGLGTYGTAFRISQDLLLTNWHVLHHPQTGALASAVTAEFGYEDDGRGGALAATVVPCDVASIVTEEDDDWAVIAAPLEPAWPVLKLSEAAEPVLGGPAYIVQHPAGDRKRLGYVRNQISAFDDRVLHYLTDTDYGSSGSPVFDADGRLIGLHRAGGSPQAVVGKPPLSKNEGVRIPRVVAGLAAHGVERKEEP